MNVVNRVTLAGLKQNRTRTAVTIIGVVLSAAMITAVVILVASLQAYLVAFSAMDSGNWHTVLHAANVQDLRALAELDDLDGLAVTSSAGYSLLPAGNNRFKPYLHLLQFDQAAMQELSVNLLSGRMPSQQDEVLIPELVNSGTGVHYRVGDRITLTLGQRVSEDGKLLTVPDGYQRVDHGLPPERLVGAKSRVVTVVGICSRLPQVLEPHFAAGYTLVTPLDREGIGEKTPLDIFWRAKRPTQVFRLGDQIRNARQVDRPEDLEYNSEMLRFMGLSQNDNFIAVFYSMAAVLLALIVVGSVALIHNSFAISVSERVRQFGLLSGVGATPRQLRGSVLFEAAVIAGIGIPLGLLSGLLGIKITLYSLRDSLAGLIGSVGGQARSIPFPLVFPWWAIAATAGLALLTILLSAYIPARRTARISAMDAIRQAADVRLTARQVRTSGLSRRLFGIEGDFALKNLKRNRKRYRSTVVSLFISVVLFISALSFSASLGAGATDVYAVSAYDFGYYLGSGPRLDADTLRAYQNILALDRVKQGSIVTNVSYYAKLAKEQLTPEYYQERVRIGAIADEGKSEVQVSVFYLDSATFGAYVRELGIDQALFRRVSPTGILIDRQHYYDRERQQYRNEHLLAGKAPANLHITSVQGSREEVEFVSLDVALVAQAEDVPFGVSGDISQNTLTLIMEDKLTLDQRNEFYATRMFFSTYDTALAEQDIRQELLAVGLPVAELHNAAAAQQSSRSLVTVISVFSYGFIALMSLIALANVFNTISTNVNLRRREFAMLQSVGMTERSLRRMLDFECIFYGLKALFYGLPVATLVSYLIYRSVRQGVELSFDLPLSGMLISVLSVFLVVYASMAFSRSQMRQQNIVEALKNENI